MSEDRAPTAKPLVLPDTFDGSQCWDDWISHFENVADVNEWNDGLKLKWIKVRLVGRAQKAFQHLGEDAKVNYAGVKAALRVRFEPESKQSRYRAELETRQKKREEGWADFAEDLRVLSEKAYPQLQPQARECLALTAFLKQISNPQVAFAVRQKQPGNLDEAVTAALEMESYVDQSRTKGCVASIQEETVVAATGSQQDHRLLLLVEKLVDRVEKLEKSSKEAYRRDRPPLDRMKTSHQGSGSQHDYSRACWNCGKIGHLAKNCFKRPSRSGQSNPNQQGN